jgi:gliding motility-associated-like protein
VGGEMGETYTVVDPGTYTVNFTNGFGCTGTDKIQIVRDCKPKIDAPNAFRPGNAVEFDNSFFTVFPRFISTEDFNIFIFNRWGEMVFQSDQKDFKWNGGYENNLGKPLPPGTYAWVAKYKSDYRPERGTIEKRGGVVLIR